MKNRKTTCPLATDFNFLDKQAELSLERRSKKQKIYNALEEYLEVLEAQLELETDLYSKSLIEIEIKKIKKELKKYYVPSMLAATRYNSSKSNEKMDISSFQLIKKRIDNKQE